MRKLLTIGLCACLLIAGMSNAETPQNEARIGVLAYRGSDELHRKWVPLREYLTAVIPDWSFRIVPMTLSSAAEQIKSGQLDFVVTNPGHFVTLNRDHRMSVLASRSQKKSDGRLSTEFGSAIITHKDSGIESLSDVAGKSVAAVGADAFGGFQVAWYELDRAGVDLFADTSGLTFVGFPMDQVVAEVLAENTDVGLVRSGLMEQLISEGRVNAEDFEFLNSNVVYDHPDTVSTNLYPEWPFAALITTDPELKTRVALALLGSANSPLAELHEMNDMWSAPLPYHSVEALTEAFEARTQNSGFAHAVVSLSGLWPVLLILCSLGVAVKWRQIRRRQAAPDPAFADEPGAREVTNLTRREQEVLALIARGLSTKEIAIDLGVSPKTVEFHRANLLRKFDARTSSQLVAMATQGKPWHVLAPT